MEDILRTEYEKMYISTNKFDRITEEGEDLSRLFKKNIHLNEGQFPLYQNAC